MAKSSGDGDKGGGDEVAKAAMRVATPTTGNPNPNQSVERWLQPPILLKKVFRGKASSTSLCF